MHHRRSTATALVAVLLPLAAALTSCGFDYPTDRVNTIAAGVNNRDASVEVLGARVVAAADGQGRLIGTLVYSVNDADAPASLTAVQGVEGTEVQVTVPGDLEVAPNGHVNLAADDVPAIALVGDFAAGDVLTLSYAFSTDEIVTLEVPVVKPCGQYAEIVIPEADADDAEETAESDEEEAHEEESDDTYLCEHTPEPVEEEGGH